jgi:H+/Cl- antiporter ClcA
MTLSSNLTTQPVQPASLIKKMLIGAGIALLLISIFLYGVKHPQPEWGPYWMIRPLIMMTLAGATGGLVFYFLNNHFTYQDGWKKALAIVASILIYIIGLWMGFVLGLDGTLWN